MKKFNKLITQLARVAHDSQMPHVPVSAWRQIGSLIMNTEDRLDS